MLKIYKSTKHLISLITAAIITYNWEYFHVLLQTSLNIPSEVVAYGISITILTAFFSLVIELIEYLITSRLGIISVSLLNEHKLEGTTPLYLSEDPYKRFYIYIFVEQYNQKFEKSAKLTFIFPKGVTVDLENDYDFFGKKENEVSVLPADFGLNSKGTYVRIPIIVAKGSQNIEGNTTIKCVHNIRWWNILTHIKYDEKEFRLKEEEQ